MNKLALEGRHRWWMIDRRDSKNKKDKKILKLFNYERGGSNSGTLVTPSGEYYQKIRERWPSGPRRRIFLCSLVLQVSRGFESLPLPYSFFSSSSS